VYMAHPISASELHDETTMLSAKYRDYWWQNTLLKLDEYIDNIAHIAFLVTSVVLFLFKNDASETGLLHP
jgi:hypothetical protein